MFVEIKKTAVDDVKSHFEYQQNVFAIYVKSRRTTSLGLELDVVPVFSVVG